MGANISGHAVLNIFPVMSLLHGKAESDSQSGPPECREPWLMPLSRLIPRGARERILALKSTVASTITAAFHSHSDSN